MMSLMKEKQSRRSIGETALRVTLVGIIATSAFFILKDMHLMEFKYDEFDAVELVFRKLSYGEGMFGLTSSTGLKNPPGFINALAPFGHISLHPIFLTTAVSASNILAIGLLAITLSRLFGTTAGLTGTATYSSSAWVWLFARKLWAQNILTPLCMVLFISIVCYSRNYSLKDNRQRIAWLSIASLTIGVASTIHMSMWFFGLSLMAVTLAFHPRHFLKDAGISISLISMPLIGYISSVLTNKGSATTATSRVGQLMPPTDKLLEAVSIELPGHLSNLIRIATSGDFYRLTFWKELNTISMPGFMGFALGWSYILGIAIVMASLVISSVLLTRKIWKRDQTLAASEKTVLIYILASIVTALLYSASGAKAHMHYAIVAFPTVPASVAYFIRMTQELTNKKHLRRASHRSLTSSYFVLPIVLTAFSIQQLCVVHTSLTYISENRQDSLGEYGRPWISSKDYWINRWSGLPDLQAQMTEVWR